MAKSKVVPHENDILLGRGGSNNKHEGNEQLRSMARELAEKYSRSSKKAKSDLSRSLVQRVRDLDPPGRFLKITLYRDGSGPEWDDVGDEAAREKTSQVLRDAVGMMRHVFPSIRRGKKGLTKKTNKPTNRSAAKSKNTRFKSEGQVLCSSKNSLKVTPDNVASGYSPQNKKQHFEIEFGPPKLSQRSVPAPQMNGHVYARNPQHQAYHPATRYDYYSSRSNEVPTVSPDMMDQPSWDGMKPSHNYPFTSVNVSVHRHHGHPPPYQNWQETFPVHERSSAYTYSHNCGIEDDWNIIIEDPDDLSWASENKKPLHNSGCHV